MFYIKTLKHELSTAKTYEHSLLEVRSVVDRHRCHTVAKSVHLLMRIIASLLRYTGYLNFIKDPISHVLLLILSHVLLLSCL